MNHELAQLGARGTKKRGGRVISHCGCSGLYGYGGEGGGCGFRHVGVLQGDNHVSPNRRSGRAMTRVFMVGCFGLVWSGHGSIYVGVIFLCWCVAGVWLSFVNAFSFV